MKEYSFGNYKAEIDVETTLKWYVEYKGWGCECGHCRNFTELAKNKKLPEQIIEILDKLCIAPEKATYVGELFTDCDGIHYQFSYRIAGKITDSATADDNNDFVRCCHEPYPYGAPDFPQPHFDLEFYATLPWNSEEDKNR